MNGQKKLFLLDAMALIYRAYFAFSHNHRVTSKGQNTSAIFGFATTLLEVLKKERPTHIAVVFDTAAPTHHHVDFSAYKANRAEIPEDLAQSIPFIIRLIKAFNIPAIFSDGYEADDIIGTLAKKAETLGFTTYMMTPDKDFGQLVDEHTFIYKPSRAGNGAQVLGIQEVCKRWELKNVSQVIDILGLMGDSVDNIPGIPGVGEKTAIQLVQQFGSIENLLQNTDQLKGKLREKVEMNKEIAIQSKRLATIMVNVPIEFNEQELCLKEPNEAAIKELFSELEFRRLDKLVFGETRAEVKINTQVPESMQTGMFGNFEEIEMVEISVTAPQYETIESTSHEYYIIETGEKIKELAGMLGQQKKFAFHAETNSTDTNRAQLNGLSFSFNEKQAYYVPLPVGNEKANSILNEFKNIFEDENIEKISQNIKCGIQMLKRYGIDLKGKLFDIMIAHFLIQPDMRHNIDVLSETYLNYLPVSRGSVYGKKNNELLFQQEASGEKFADYAAEAADISFQLKPIFDLKLSECGVQKLFDEVELPLVPVLASMEAEGIKVDKAALFELSSTLVTDINAMEQDIQFIAGAKFNVSSPRQVGEVLFDVLKIAEKPQKTKTGQYSTGEEILCKLENKHPIVRKILDYRELVKLKNTYVDVLPALINARTGRVHTTYNQIVAVTGRLSSDNPNLQNIPIRTNRGREIRKAFVPRNDDYLLLSADYSQIELRIIASLSKDPAMTEAFNSGADIHTATAAKVYNVPMEEVTSEMRRNAKMVNFGIIYGISAFGLAERLNIARGEAKIIIENYFSQYPYIKDYMDKNIAKARKNGYVETILGRRRYLRDINSANATVRGYAERNAINAPIQGSAADMIKIAMIQIHKAFKKQNIKSRLLLQVHDELVFDVLKEEADEVKNIVKNCMNNALPMNVPLEITTGTGNNWLEAH